MLSQSTRPAHKGEGQVLKSQAGPWSVSYSYRLQLYLQVRHYGYTRHERGASLAHAAAEHRPARHGAAAAGILVHGAAGVGKTELVRWVGAAVDRKLQERGAAAAAGNVHATVPP